MRYVRPLVQVGPARPDGAVPLGHGWFTDVEVMSRDAASCVLPISEVPADVLDRCRVEVKPADIMGILNVTPDSFSDGGRHASLAAAVAHAQRMVAAGATIIDVGGESTRPGATPVPADEEVRRTAPVIAALRDAGVGTRISIDTRKAVVAAAALDAGADIVNDVSGFTHDPDLASLCAARAVPVCVMHAQGDPQTMQENPSYGNVLLDVYDFLHERIETLEAAGIPRSHITVDPGIGFGKALAHNLALLNRISLFHGLGVPILLGASRKRFIGTLGDAPEAADRAPGSIGVALAALAQGVQVLRVHDVAEHAQAIALWRASVANPGA